jgi:Tfp pilus assembly protein PilF
MKKWLPRYSAWMVIFFPMFLSACMGSYHTVKLDTRDAYESMLQGQQYFQERRFEEAERAFSDAYTKLRKARNDCIHSPDCKVKDDEGLKGYMVYNLSMRALCRYYLNRLRAAENDASLALEYDPNYPQALYTMGLVHIAYGEYAQARQYRDRLEQMSNNPAYSQDERSAFAAFAADLDRRMR